MSQKFSLPCACGSATAVETRLAGGSVVCSHCGNTLPVPKLRDLKQLQPIEDPVAPRRYYWGGVQGALFGLGVLAMAIGGGSTFYTLSLRDRLDTSKPEISKFVYELDNIPLIDSWKLWDGYRQIRVETRNPPIYLRAREKVIELDRWLSFFAVLGAVGAALVVCAFVSSLFSKPPT